MSFKTTSLSELREIELRESHKAWNENCHPEDRIDWQDWLDEHGPSNTDKRRF